MSEPDFVYYIGGPADLTKQILKNRHRRGDMLRFAVVEPLRPEALRGDSPFDLRKESRLDYRVALYRLHQVERNLFIAIFDQFE